MPAVSEQRSRRIVVLFGGETDGGVASVLDSLVSTSRADVTGVFIEDHTLFRTAELPFATEVCRVTTVRRPLTTTQLERQMRVLALRAEQAIRRIAERAGSPWSFRRHRGRLSTALADAPDVDVVVIGTVRSALAPAGELRATARTVRAAESEARKPIAVLFEPSSAGDRALDAGVELAERTGRKLVVFVPASLTEAPAQLYERLDVLGPARASIRSVTSEEPTTLLSAVRRAAPAVFVVSAGETGFGEGRVADLQHGVRCPLVVVR